MAIASLECRRRLGETSADAASAWPSLKPAAMSGAEPRKYQQRRPETTALYRIIQQHLESFLTHAHESSGTRLPKYVENEFRRYLECGIHAHGVGRSRCAAVS
jgi:hypothetical protein